jgi:Na+-transporting NADH:ubiquinone oxidoreductase subunit NqrB
MKKAKVKIVIGVLAGGIFGYLLYRFVGCKTGACIITSKPWSSILYGMLLGLLFGLKW